MELISIVGQPLAQGWSKVIFNSDQSLFCTLAVTGSSAKNVGHDLSLQLENSRPRSTAELHNLLLDLLSQARSLNVQLQLALVWFQPANDKIAAAAYQGKVILQRSQKIGALLGSKTVLKIVEGSSRPQDQLILLTHSAADLEPVIKQNLSDKIEPQELKALLEDQVARSPDSSLTAAAFIQPQLDLKKAAVQKKTSRSKIGSGVSKTKRTSQSHKSSQSKQSFRSRKAQSNESSQRPNFQAQTASKSKESINQLNQSKLNQTPKSAEVKFSHNSNSGEDAANKDIVVKLNRKNFTKLAKNITHFLSSKFKLIFQAVKNNANKFHPGKIAGFARQIGRKLIQLPQSLKKLRTGKSIYLGKNKFRKIIRIIAAAVVVMGLLGGGWLLWQRRINNKQTLIQQELEPARELLDQAQQTAEIDVIEARDQTNQALELITVKQKEYESDNLAQKFIQEYLEEANEFYTQISGQIELNQLDIFFDFREISPNFLSSHAVFSNDQMLVFDQGQNSLITLDVESKETTTLTLEEDLVQDIAASESEVFLLNQGIDLIPLPLNAESEPVSIKEEGDSDRDAIFIDYFEGYLYVFNPESRNIFRYVLRDNELSDPAGWLTNKMGIEFEEVNSFVVDGQIWLADKTGAILKFETGEPVEFEVTGLEKELGETVQLYARQDTEYLYVLEPAKQRLLILSRQGELIKEITSPTLAGANQFVVDESRQQAFAFSGSIVYLIELDQ